MASNNINCHLIEDEEIKVCLLRDGKSFMINFFGHGSDLTIFPDSAEQLQEIAFAIESALQDADLDLESRAKEG